MRWVKKTGVKLFRLCFATDRPSRKVEPKKPFFYYVLVRKPDMGFSRKRPFSTDKSDCIRNGLNLGPYKKQPTEY